MKIHRLNPKIGLAQVTPEDVEDLWRLRRIIATQDLVAGETTREVKQTGDYVRPDKGERIRVKMVLRVAKVSLDSTLARLRVTGKIVDVSEEFLSKGSFHSMGIILDQRISVRKEKWSNLDTKILRDGESEGGGFAILAVDRREAGLGVARGTHLHIYPTLESGESGKFYSERGKKGESYFGRVRDLLRSTSISGLKLFIAGPGPTKTTLANFLTKTIKELEGKVETVGGLDLSGEDGVYMALRSPELKNAIQDSKIAQATSVLEESMRRVSTDDRKVALSFRNADRAADMGAVEAALVSDKAFELKVAEEDLIKFLNSVESSRGRIYLVDSSTDVGSQVTALGGIVALLRYPVDGW